MKCPYCDFNSHTLKNELPETAYIQKLIENFDAMQPVLHDRPIQTIFMGGGTPSLFSPQAIGMLLQSLKQRCHIVEDAEITLEANPGTVEQTRFSGYRDIGINRISLGIQSFDPVQLKI